MSIIAHELDEAVEGLRTRPLDAGPYTFVAAEARVLKVRENYRVVGVDSAGFNRSTGMFSLFKSAPEGIRTPNLLIGALAKRQVPSAATEGDSCS